MAKVTRGRLRSQKSCSGPMRIAKVTVGRLKRSKNDFFILIVAFFRAEIKHSSVRSRSRLEPHFFARSRSRFICPEPTSDVWSRSRPKGGGSGPQHWTDKQKGCTDHFINPVYGWIFVSIRFSKRQGRIRIPWGNNLRKKLK